MPIGSPAEVPCARCGERIAGLAWGDRCRACLKERQARARRLARRISLAAALVMAIVLGLRSPVTETSRLWIGGGVLITFILVRVIAMRIAMEYLPDQGSPKQET